MSAAWTPTRTRIVAALTLVVTFVAGAFTGAALSRRHALGPPPAPLEHMADQLHLSPKQQQHVQQILDRYQPRIGAVISESFPKLSAIHDEMSQEIRALLTPEQQRTFDAMKPEGPPPFPPGGPPPGFPPGPPGFGPPPGFSPPPPR